MSDMRVLISGLGLMGSSLAETLTRSGVEVLVHHRREEPMAEAARLHIGTPVADPVQAMGDVAVAVVCTPVSTIVDQVRRLAAGPGDAVITDVGSTKGSLVAHLADLAKSGRFVGSHPMCGSHLQGLANRDPDLYAGALTLVTPVKETPERAISAVERIWQRARSSTLRMDPALHDQAVAQGSHLPHILAACAAGLPDAQGIAVAASGFRDTTRVAAGSPQLWADILIENREAVVAELRRCTSHLKALEQELMNGERQALEDWLEIGAKGRRLFDEKR